MPEPQEPERRRDHVTRALFKRVQALESVVDTLKKIGADQDKAIHALEREAVTYKALAATVVTLALALFGGAWRFSSGVQESTAKTMASAITAQTSAVSSQAQKLDAFMDRQSAINIKTEALYLVSVENKPRSEARAVVLQTAKEK